MKYAIKINVWSTDFITALNRSETIASYKVNFIDEPLEEMLEEIERMLSHYPVAYDAHAYVSRVDKGTCSEFFITKELLLEDRLAIKNFVIRKVTDEVSE